MTPDSPLRPVDPVPIPVLPALKRRRRSTRRRQQRRRRLAALAGTAVALGLAVVAWTTSAPPPSALPPIPAAATWEGTFGAEPPALTFARPSRPRYRYSVIPGGVYSPAELEVALATDPVAAAHYAGFDVARARVTRVEAPRAVYVSYRVGDAVYWNSRKVWLQPGETLLTDGVQQARGRCGNLVSEVIAGPVAEEEPPVEVLDEPIVDPPPGLAPLQAFNLLFADPPPPIESQPLPTLESVPVDPPSLVPIPPPLVVERLPEAPPLGPIPEPGTLVLIGTGAAGLAARKWRSVRAAR
jgi:hypothetical protein